VVYVFGGNLWSAAQLRVVFEIYNIYILLIKKRKLLFLIYFYDLPVEWCPVRSTKNGGGVLSTE
jgi:hypothetical protein